MTWITHYLNGLNRGFNYDYDNVGNRKYIRRLGNADMGDIFAYDLADQVNGVQLNVANPGATPTPTPNIAYDANGNRTWFGPYGQLEQYAINNLNQYTSRTVYIGGNGGTTVAGYNVNGNLTIGLDDSMYSYDAQNRVLAASGHENGAPMFFAYDGLNRQISRTVTGSTTYNVWDGWDLVQEYHMSGNNVIEDASYLYGATGLVKNLKSGNYYYQDGSGGTSHLADANGNLLEWYRYDLQGKPFFYNANDTQLSASNYSVRHLFTGQQWYKEVGLYDLRNRFTRPTLAASSSLIPSTSKVIQQIFTDTARITLCGGVIRPA